MALKLSVHDALFFIFYFSSLGSNTMHIIAYFAYMLYFNKEMIFRDNRLKNGNFFFILKKIIY